MPDPLHVHSIDIERCTECPFVDAHTGQDKRGRCTHPERAIIDELDVRLWSPPPKRCPMRAKPNLLRITS